MSWLLLVWGLTGGDLSARAFAKKVDGVVADPAFRQGFWGVVIHAPLRGKTLYVREPDRNFRPASNLKILTTLAGFHYLGPDYRFQTVIGTDGVVEDSVVNGNLVIRAGGDPSFSGRYTGHWHTQDLVDRLAARIVDGGVARVNGDLVVDGSFFDDITIPLSWEWDDIGRWYAVPLTALSLNDALYDFSFASDEWGVGTWSVWPVGLPQFLLHPAEDKPLGLERDWGTDHFRGNMGGKACMNRQRPMAAWDPAEQFRLVLRRALSARGVQFEGRPLPAGESFEPLVIWESDSLALLARVLMKKSQNHYADALFKTIGREVLGEGTMGNGAQLVSDFMADLGLTDGHQLRDGSGMSAQNNLQPRQLVELLAFGLQAPYRDAWLGTMPIMGRDGTLESRGDASTEGRVWAKTGYINRSRNLAGYAETLDGEPLIFALLVNNYACPTSEVEKAQDRVCALMRRLKPNRAVRKQKDQLFTLSRFFDAIGPNPYPVDRP